MAIKEVAGMPSFHAYYKILGYRMDATVCISGNKHQIMVIAMVSSLIAQMWVRPQTQ